MPKYRVQVTRAITYNVEVEATNERVAEDVALETIPPVGIPVDKLPSVDSTTLLQIGEPWVYGWSGSEPKNLYLGRPDGYSNTKGLLVFTRSFRSYFSEPEVELLLARVKEHVGAVHSHWNGCSHNTFSVQLKKDFGRLSDEQVAALMKPREEGI